MDHIRTTALLLVAAVLFLWYRHRHRKRTAVCSQAIVVARYNEDVAWLRTVDDAGRTTRIYLYLAAGVRRGGGCPPSKGPDLTADEMALLPPETIVKRLPNVGRCDHTFLYHIVRHYDVLEAVTVFASGDGDDPRKGPKIRAVIRKAALTHDTVLAGSADPDVRRSHGDFRIDAWRSTNERNRIHEGDDDHMQWSAVRPFGAWYDAEFPELASVPIHVVCWESIFAVHRTHIQQHPRVRACTIMRAARPSAIVTSV